MMQEKPGEELGFIAVVFPEPLLISSHAIVLSGTNVICVCALWGGHTWEFEKLGISQDCLVKLPDEQTDSQSMFDLSSLSRLSMLVVRGCRLCMWQERCKHKTWRHTDHTALLLSKLGRNFLASSTTPVQMCCAPARCSWCGVSVSTTAPLRIETKNISDPLFLFTKWTNRSAMPGNQDHLGRWSANALSPAYVYTGSYGQVGFSKLDGETLICVVSTKSLPLSENKYWGSGSKYSKCKLASHSAHIADGKVKAPILWLPNLITTVLG